jgi:hypothetical protein
MHRFVATHTELITDVLPWKFQADLQVMTTNHSEEKHWSVCFLQSLYCTITHIYTANSRCRTKGLKIQDHGPYATRPWGFSELYPGAKKLVSGFPVSFAAEHLAIVGELYSVNGM